MQDIKQVSKRISEIVEHLQGELFSFIQHLVQTPSLPGRESEAQQLVAAKLRELALEVEKVPIPAEVLKTHPAFCDDGIPFEERYNVVGRWPSGNKGALILNGHIDVVSPGQEELWGDSPWSGKIVDGKLYGRGSCDMKAGLGTALFAVKTLQQLGFQPRKDILLECVTGEESGGIGTLSTIVKGYTADAAVILEPTQLQICPVQAGALTFRITVRGKAVHACMKKFGVSAVEKFYQIFTALQQLEKKRHQAFHNPLYDDPMNVAPLSVGTVRGGAWHSTVPDELTAEGRYGVFPGESIATAQKLFAETLQKVSAKDPWLKSHPPILEWFEGQFEAGETDQSAPIISTLKKSHKIITGKAPRLQGVTYGSDLRLFTNHAGIQAVLYGPGDVLQAHTVDEFIPLEEVLKGTKILALTIYEFCKEE